MLACVQNEREVKQKVYSFFHRIQTRPGKSNPTRMIRTERIEILPELTPKMIALKFTRTENDPYRTELNPNIFCLNHFSFQKKAYWTKISWSEVDPNLKQSDLKLIPNRIMLTKKWPDPKLTRSEPEPNDPFARSRCIYPWFFPANLRYLGRQNQVRGSKPHPLWLFRQTLFNS